MNNMLCSFSQCMLSLVAAAFPFPVAVRKLCLCPNYGFSFGLNLRLGIAASSSWRVGGALDWDWATASAASSGLGSGLGLEFCCCCCCCSVSGLLHSNLVSNIICVKWRNKRFGRRIRCVAYKMHGTRYLAGHAHINTHTDTYRDTCDTHSSCSGTSIVRRSITHARVAIGNGNFRAKP